MSILVIKEERNLPNGVETDKKYRVLDMIKIEQINSIVVQAINEYGSEEKLEVANKVGEVVLQMFKKKHLLNENAQQSFVDIVLAAALLHNLFYEEDDFTTLFKARKELASIMEKEEAPQQVQDALFQTIEAQLGDDTPVPTSRPISNSPTELLAWAVWFVKEYEPQE